MNRIRYLARLSAGILGAAIIVTGAFAKDKPILKAREAAKAGDWETAIHYVQATLFDDETNAEAYSIWGDSYWANGDTSEAVAKYEQAIGYDPKLANPVLVLTRYYLKSENLANAEKIVAAAEEKDPKHKIDELRVARGMILAQQGDFAEATRLLVSVTAKNQDNPLYPQILARLYADAGVKEQAAKYYEDSWKLNPGNLDLAYEYALILQDLQRYTEALDLFKVVQEKNPDNRTVDYMIGRLYYAAGKWGEASAQLQKAIEKRPDHFLSQYLLGKSVLEYSKKEKINFYKQAETALRKAHELKPARTDVIDPLAEILSIEGRLAYQQALSDTSKTNALALCDTAIAYFRELQSYKPESKSLNSYMSRIWYKIGNLDSTIHYARLELLVKPDDAAELARLVGALQRQKNQAGLIDALRPRYDKLDWTVRKAEGDTTVLPQDIFIEKYAGILANAYSEQKQVPQARELLNNILGYKPAWKDGHVLNAYIDMSKENYGGAIQVLEAAVKALPEDGELWVMLGDCRYFANQKAKPEVLKAKECYRKGMMLGNKDGAEKYKQLEKVK